MLTTLADAKAYLGGTATGVPTSPAEDEQLEGLLVAATPVIEQLVGPVLQRPVTEAVTSNGGVLTLSQYPVVAITSVTGRDGIARSLVSYPAVNLAAGLVGAPAGSTEVVTVTYTAGRVAALPVPANIRLATLELVAHWWRQRRGGSASYLPAGDDDVPVGDNGGVVMWRVKQMLGPDLRGPRVA